MKLKDYQKRCLMDIKLYLHYLVEYKNKYDKYIEKDKEMALDYNFPEKAWNQCEIKNSDGETIAYNSKINGLNEPLPNFCIKVPTGERVIIVTGCINVLVSRVSGTLTKYNSCIA